MCAHGTHGVCGVRGACTVSRAWRACCGLTCLCLCFVCLCVRPCVRIACACMYVEVSLAPPTHPLFCVSLSFSFSSSTLLLLSTIYCHSQHSVNAGVICDIDSRILHAKRGRGRGAVFHNCNCKKNNKPSICWQKPARDIGSKIRCNRHNARTYGLRIIRG